MKRFLKILEHPAWNGVSCLLTFIATFGLVGVIIGLFSKLIDKSKELATYLSEPITLPKYYLIIGVLLLATTLMILQNWLMEKRRRILRNKESIRQGEFFRVWGVFWRYLRDNFYDEPHVDGPYCPIHLLHKGSGLP